MAKQYDGAESVLDQSISINDTEYKIVGVVADAFNEPSIFETKFNAGVWLPLGNTPLPSWQLDNWQYFFGEFKFVGELSDQYSIDQARQLLSQDSLRSFSHHNQAIEYWNDLQVKTNVRSLRDVITAGNQAFVTFLVIGALTLLLIACVNLTNLFLSRTASKHRELSIIASLGAKKVHLFRLLWSEAAILTVSAALLSLLVAQGGFSLLKAFAAEQLPRVSELHLSGQHIFIAISIALLLALVFSVVSISTVNYRRLQESLQSSGKGSGQQISKTVRHGLIVSQVFLISLLLATNVSLLKTSMHNISHDIDFNMPGLYDIQLSHSDTGMSSETYKQKMYEFEQMLVQSELFESISMSNAHPILYDSESVPISPLEQESNQVYVAAMGVDHRYFDVTGVAVESGRGFSEAEYRSKEPVALVSKKLAAALFGETDAIGKSIVFQGNSQPFKIVGIAADIYFPQHQKNIATLYTTANDFHLHAVVRADMGVSRQQLVDLLGEVDSRFAVDSFESVETFHSRTLFRDFVVIVTVIAIGLITVFLAVIGIYGVMSYNTRMRRTELGIRMALGAKPLTIVKTVLGSNAVSASIGLVGSLVTGLVIVKENVAGINNIVDFDWLGVFISAAIVVSIIVLACIMSLLSIVTTPPSRSLNNGFEEH